MTSPYDPENVLVSGDHGNFFNREKSVHCLYKTHFSKSFHGAPSSHFLWHKQNRHCHIYISSISYDILHTTWYKLYVVQCIMYILHTILHTHIYIWPCLLCIRHKKSKERRPTETFEKMCFVQTVHTFFTIEKVSVVFPQEYMFFVPIGLVINH